MHEFQQIGLLSHIPDSPADGAGQGVVPLLEGLAIAVKIADGLEAAHEKAIVHRDLEPGNIKLKPDGARRNPCTWH